MKNALSILTITMSILFTSNFAFANSTFIPCSVDKGDGDLKLCNEEDFIHNYRLLKESNTSSNILKNGTKVGIAFTITSGLSRLIVDSTLGAYFTEIAISTIGLGVAALLFSSDTEASAARDKYFLTAEGFEEFLNLDESDAIPWIRNYPLIAEKIMNVSAVLANETRKRK